MFNKTFFGFTKVMSIGSLVSILLVACVSEPPAPSNGQTALNAAAIAMINKNCFEVVVEKPVNDSLTYDKPLNWDLLDFNTRTDKYVPLGTAFAISNNELVTAAHVLSLDDESLVYPKRYIRQKRSGADGQEEKIWELDSIKAFSTNRDYVVFTVKDLTFDTWFEQAPEVVFNQKIYTAGNAYGEGIVIREGLLLDSIPESENGEWKYLKSSIATNPGNSGGPLLNEKLQVLGIVLQKKDDFCYSLKMSDIRPGKGLLHKRLTFKFTIFNKTHVETYDSEMPLPAPYREVMAWIHREDQRIGADGMDDLFAEHEDDLFPRGPNAIKALYTYTNSSFPQIYLQDSNDSTWFLSQTKTSSSDLGNNGTIYWGSPYENSDIALLDLEHPDNIKAADITDKPELMMDLLLKGIKFERKVTQGDSGSRITSMGKPFHRETHRDKWGRVWNINQWLMDYADQVIIIWSTPTPQGVSMLYKQVNSSNVYSWMYDMEKIVDYMNVSYMGTLEEWKAFLGREDFLFGPLKNLSMSYKTGSNFSLSTSDFNLKADSQTIAIDDKSTLYVTMNIYVKENSPVWDVRHVLLTESSVKANNILLVRLDKPHPDLPKAYQDSWKNTWVSPSHPYTGEPYREEGITRICALHSSLLGKNAGSDTQDHVYAVLISKSGEAGNDEMKALLKRQDMNVVLK